MKSRLDDQQKEMSVSRKLEETEQEVKEKNGKGTMALAFIVVILCAVAAYCGYYLFYRKPYDDACAAFNQEVQNYNKFYSEYKNTTDELNTKIDEYNSSVQKLEKAISEVEKIAQSGTAYDKSLVDDANHYIEKQKQKRVKQNRRSLDASETFDLNDMNTKEINNEIDAIQKKEIDLENEIKDIKDQIDKMSVPDYSKEIKKLQSMQEKIKESIEVYNTMDPSADVSNANKNEKNASSNVEEDSPVQLYDPFQNLSLAFSGIAPNGKAKIKKKSDKGIDGEYKFIIDKDSHLDNGDTVTVKVECNNKLPIEHKTIRQLNQDLAADYGKVISITEKTYKVSGLNYYLLNSKQISDKTIKKMKNSSIDNLKEDLEKKYGKDISINEIKYIGNYFLLNKEQRNVLSGKDFNKFYLLFTVSATIDLGEKGDYRKDIEYVFSSEYDDLMNLADNSNGTDLSDVKKPSDNFTIDSGVKKNIAFNYTFKFYGYKDVDSAYNKIITSQAEKYKYENNVDD